jgi:hypothetical protein
MLDPDKSALIDSLVRPLLDGESRELNDRIRRAAERAAQAGVPGSGLAFFQSINAYFEHYRELATNVWTAMLRVLDETGISSNPELSGDLKQKFDAYMIGTANRIRSSMVAYGSSGRSMPTETFESVFEKTRAKYHAEIELRCQRPAVRNDDAQIRIGELNMGDNYTAGQVGAMGPQAHAHDMNFQQVIAQLAQIDMRTLASELGMLRREMKQIANGPEQDVAIGQIAAAEVAAQNGDASSVARHLRNVGKWVGDFATKVGAKIAAEAIMKSMGWP